MVRSSLYDLSSSGTIVLFTPVITPAFSGTAPNGTSDHVDPFEALGRALSRFHRRIRHVPYVPRVGFTETHDAFISQADAVIVVVCEPNFTKTGDLAEQVAFAEAAQDCTQSNDVGPIEDDDIILIQFGDPSSKSWPDMSQFDIIVKCRTYSVATAQDIARKLFDSRK